MTLDAQLHRLAPLLELVALVAGGVLPLALGLAALAFVFRVWGASPLRVLARVRRDQRILGTVRRRGYAAPVGLSIRDSRQHLHLLGPTGTGKSTLLLNLAAQDIAQGRGCAVLDPKGDLVRDLVARIPRARASEVVYIGPDDPHHSVGINPLEVGPQDDVELVAENTLAIFKRIYAEHWGPRTDDVLKSALLTLLQTPTPTLAHIPLLLGDDAYRRQVTRTLRDPIGLESFWRWYEALSEQQRAEVTGPLLNKLRDFLLRSRLRRLLCQPRSTVDLGRLMDTGGILLADLGTGRWGESASALAGSFLVARLWQAVLARQAVPEERRRDFLLYIDEFQTFQGIRGPFADALAQARGLHLGLTLANQHLGQLPRELQAAVRSNARSRVVFQCAYADAMSLAREFAPLDVPALLSLGRFEAAARLSRGGRRSQVQLLRTLPPPPPPSDAADPAEVIAASRARFATAHAAIDAALRAAAAESPRSSEPAPAVRVR